GGQAEPKGDINQLWKLLGVEMAPNEIVWQDFNPEQKLGNVLPPELVFIDQELTAHGTPAPFDQQDRISSDMHQVLFLWPGSVRPAGNSMSKLNMQKLAVTGHHTGTIGYQELEGAFRAGDMLDADRKMTNDAYILAAHVTGKATSDADLY